jgi:NAD(P) transhydrogenase subunit alpha
MYSNNIGNFVDHFWDKERTAFALDPANELMRGCLITHAGKVVNETVKTHHNL